MWIPEGTTGLLVAETRVIPIETVTDVLEP